MSELEDALRLLAGEREPSFGLEKAVKLYQFKTWIFSLGFEMVLTAGTLLAVKLLEDSEKRHCKHSYDKTAKFLAEMLEKDNYRRLYDKYIGERGGWTRLMRDPTLKEFDATIQSTYAAAETVSQIVGYRIRVLEHHNLGPAHANISRGMYFVYSGDEPISGKTIRKRWGLFTRSAPFIYASVGLGFNFYPHPLAFKNSVKNIKEEARDLDSTKSFIATARYVYERLLETGSAPLEIAFPESIEPLKPVTQPLSDADLERMLDYKQGVARMKDN